MLHVLLLSSGSASLTCRSSLKKLLWGWFFQHQVEEWEEHASVDWPKEDQAWCRLDEEQAEWKSFMRSWKRSLTWKKVGQEEQQIGHMTSEGANP